MQMRAHVHVRMHMHMHAYAHAYAYACACASAQAMHAHDSRVSMSPHSAARASTERLHRNHVGQQIPELGGESLAEQPARAHDVRSFTSYKLQVASYKLRVTSYKLQATTTHAAAPPHGDGGLVEEWIRVPARRVHPLRPARVVRQLLVSVAQPMARAVSGGLVGLQQVHVLAVRPPCRHDVVVRSQHVHMLFQPG